MRLREPLPGCAHPGKTPHYSEPVPLRETSTNTSVLPTAIRQEARRYAQLREDKTARENTSGHHVCV